MFGYTVSDLAALVGGTLSGEGSAAVTSIVKDNRVAVPGCLFAAMPGEKSDGHRFIASAFDAGAVCALARFVPEGETRPVITVPDVQAALETIGADFRRWLKIPVLGITGSVGKTTAKEMVASETTTISSACRSRSLPFSPSTSSPSSSSASPTLGT